MTSNVELLSCELNTHFYCLTYFSGHCRSLCLHFCILLVLTCCCPKCVHSSQIFTVFLHVFRVKIVTRELRNLSKLLPLTELSLFQRTNESSTPRKHETRNSKFDVRNSALNESLSSLTKLHGQWMSLDYETQNSIFDERYFTATNETLLLTSETPLLKNASSNPDTPPILSLRKLIPSDTERQLTTRGVCSNIWFAWRLTVKINILRQRNKNATF